ncbi:MAG TPA: glycosyltransferase [Dehalococcoidia bacterium]
MAAGRVAVVHDYMTMLGGAERVAGRMAAMYSEASLYTSVHDARQAPLAAIGGRRWQTSFLQPLARVTGPRPLLPLLPAAFQSFDLSGYETIISSTSGFAHQARKAAGAVHVAFCHTPPRFLWREDDYFAGQGQLRTLVAPILAALRRKDLGAASRVDAYVAVSNHIARRIREVYAREAMVVHPPVDCRRFEPGAERSGRFLVVSRLVRAKRVELVIEAAKRHSIALDVIGEGPDRRRLERLAGPDVRFQGYVPDAEIARAISAATAVVVAGREDFGLVTAEAQAAGRPPVAFADSGAADIVEDGVTGFLFAEPTAEAIGEAMLCARERALEAADLVASARRFDVAVFEENLRTAVEAAVASRALSLPTEAMALSGAVG